MFNLITVILNSINTIAIITKVPNIVEKDKEEYSYIIVSNNIKSTPKDTHSDYKSTSKDLD